MPAQKYFLNVTFVFVLDGLPNWGNSIRLDLGIAVEGPLLFFKKSFYVRKA